MYCWRKSSLLECLETSGQYFFNFVDTLCIQLIGVHTPSQVGAANFGEKSIALCENCDNRDWKDVLVNERAKIVNSPFPTPSKSKNSSSVFKNGRVVSIGRQYLPLINQNENGSIMGKAYQMAWSCSARLELAARVLMKFFTFSVSLSAPLSKPQES
jgi:hypothetical protein